MLKVVSLTLALVVCAVLFIGLGCGEETPTIPITKPSEKEESYVFVTEWGEPDYLFGENTRITADNSGVIFVVSYSVQKFTADGVLLEEWIGDFYDASDIAVDNSSGNVYVLNTNFIQKFTPEGILLLPNRGEVKMPNPELWWPRSIAVDSIGNLYVGSSHNGEIFKFTANGDFLTEWETKTPFYYNQDIAVNNSGNVYVVDGCRSCIQIFTSDGIFIADWPPENFGKTLFDSPTSIAIDSSGNIYVVDRYKTRVQKFAPQGAFVTEFIAGSTRLPIEQINDIAVDHTGNIYLIVRTYLAFGLSDYCVRKYRLK